MLRVGLPTALTAIAEQWPCFRGLTRQGISMERNLPLKWSASENVAWKTEIPGQGWSSPIVWGDRVFVTSATDNGTKCRVICLDRKSGKLVWKRDCAHSWPLMGAAAAAPTCVWQKLQSWLVTLTSS